MQTRTRLTTPPGQEPTPEPTRTREGPERYSPALALPVEPSYAGRLRRPLTILVVVAVLAVAGLVVFRLATSGQFQDPALTDDGTQQQVPADELPGESGG